MLLDEQRRVGKTDGAIPSVPDDSDKLGVALATLGQIPLNGLRHPEENGTCGWYIWGGERLPDDPEFFQPLHVAHLTTTCPGVLRFLALPPGWRFLLAPGQEDVWFDDSLLVPTQELELPAHIRHQVESLLANTPTAGGDAHAEAARNGGILLMGTIGAIWLLRPDGTLWEVDEEWGRPPIPLASRFYVKALVYGSERHGWLADMLPVRPAEALECRTCRGNGRIVEHVLCDTCQGLGWKAGRTP